MKKLMSILLVALALAFASTGLNASVANVGPMDTSGNSPYIGPGLASMGLSFPAPGETVFLTMGQTYALYVVNQPGVLEYIGPKNEYIGFVPNFWAQIYLANDAVRAQLLSRY